MRWWLALLLAAGVSMAAAVADLRIEGALHLLFAVAYVAGCVAAVLLVARPGLVAAMVEPPVVLLLAVGVATAVTGRTSGVSTVALGTGLGITTLFPLMAAVTAATVLIGLIRLWRRSRRVSSTTG